MPERLSTSRSAEGRLTIAVPSKGRIMEDTYAFFQRIGAPLSKPATDREYIGRMKSIDNVDVMFMSASEIASGLQTGTLHLGVTGEDLVREKASNPAQIEDNVTLIKALNFGHADLVVAVPNAWIDVRTMADLEDVTHDFRLRHHRPLRIATKYLSLTRSFFARNGISDYRIIESSGATEGAPASGVAEAIVDITSTGATLTANNLRILDDGIILKSEVQLIASRMASWSKPVQSALAKILDRVYAQELATSHHILRFSNPSQDDKGLTTRLTGDLQCEIIQLAKAGSEVLCPKNQLESAVEAIKAQGAEHITVTQAQYVFSRSNPLFDRVSQRLFSRK